MQHGFSLIETLITIALVGLLSMVGMSFTTEWSESNSLLDGSHLLGQAYSRTKAAAIRNEYGVVGSQASAALCVTNGVLSVRSAASASLPATCTTQALWQQTLNARLKIFDGSTAFTCLCLNNKAQITTAGCSACSTGSSLTLKAGNNDQALQLF